MLLAEAAPFAALLNVFCLFLSRSLLDFTRVKSCARHSSVLCFVSFVVGSNHLEVRGWCV